MHHRILIIGVTTICGLLIVIAVCLAYLVLRDRSTALHEQEVQSNLAKENVIEESKNSIVESLKTEKELPVIVATATKPIGTTKQQLVTVAPNTTGTTLKPEISKFTQTVVKLECLGKNDTVPSSGGSGISLYYDDDQHYILTNAHVARAYDGSFGGCWVYFPTKDGSFYESAYWAGMAYFYDTGPVSVNGTSYGSGIDGNTGIDSAFLVLTSPGVTDQGVSFPPIEQTHFPDALAVANDTCTTKDLAIGDPLLIFGYPGVGGQNITVTDGIFSGLVGYSNEYVKTSAKIEHGNSGGLAIRASDGCFVGVPSASTLGELESIGSILSYSFIKPFVNAYDAGFGTKNSFDGTDPYAIPLYQNVQWEKKKNAYHELVKGYDNALTFEVCDGYTVNNCTSYRTISPSGQENDILWTATVPSRKVRSNTWVSEFTPLIEYFDPVMQNLGFLRNQYVYAPDNGFAVLMDNYANDLLKRENVSDAAIFRYARILDDSIQFVVLDVSIFATYGKDCEKQPDTCEIETSEKYELYIGQPIPMHKLVTLNNVKKENILGLSWISSLATIFESLKKEMSQESSD